MIAECIHAESMNVRKLKQLCERLFKLPAQQQALSAVDSASGSVVMSLGHDNEAVLGSFNLLVRPHCLLTMFQLMSLQFYGLHGLVT